MRSKLLLLAMCLFSTSMFADNVTFCVDMSTYQGNYTIPEVNGTFNGWCGNCNPLTDQGNDIWCTTLDIPPGFIEYKFAHDSWAGQENLTPGDPCTQTTAGFTNRVHTVAGDVVLPTVSWNSCSGPNMATYDVEFCVDMSCNPNSFSNAYISGSFNSWCGDCDQLTDQGNNIYCGTINISGPIEYKFTLDNWAFQENFNQGDACTVTNSGFTNRYYDPSGNATVNYGWNSCSSSCPVLYDVEFCVDLSCIEGQFGTPYISGNFNGWCGTCDELQPQGGGTYCKTLSLLQGAMVEYKFTLDDWAQQEEFNEGDFCTISAFGFTNRFHFVSGDANLSYGWNSCSSNCTANYYVEICMDANCMPEGFGQLYASGTFNNWCGDCDPLIDQGNGTYCATILMPEGEHEFKYTRDNWAGQENFIGGEPCTKTSFGFTNRVINVAGDMLYNGVWGQCASSCNDIQGGNVEFCVCTEGVSYNFGQVYVSGNFNGWSGNANPLTNQGNGKWCATLPLNGGQIHYKFTMDDWANQEFFSFGDPCTFTVGPFTNRSHYVNGDASLDYVWESCESAGLPDGMGSMDVGYASSPGYVSGGVCSDAGPGSFEITSSGLGNSFNMDNQHILHQTLCGDGEIYAQVGDISPVGWAGVGMRENGSAGAKKAELATNLSYFIQRRIRTQTGGFAFPQQIFRPNSPWLKIKRSGSLFQGYTSTNGMQWSLVFTTQISMGSCIEVYAFAQALNNVMSPVTATIHNMTMVPSGYSLADLGDLDLDLQDDFVDGAADLEVYPNPVSDRLIVEAQGLDCTDCQVSLFNSLGQRVAVLGQDLAGNDYLELNVSGFEPGVYTLRLEGTDQSITKKVIIQQ